jgi:hypothetical protein
LKNILGFIFVDWYFTPNRDRDAFGWSASRANIKSGKRMCGAGQTETPNQSAGN